MVMLGTSGVPGLVGSKSDWEETLVYGPDTALHVSPSPRSSAHPATPMAAQNSSIIFRTPVIALRSDPLGGTS